VGKRTGVTRGDKRRNDRLVDLRRLVPRENALVGVDLAEDKQALAVTDHDSRVLARKTVKDTLAHQLGEHLDWAVGQARRNGFAAVTVACEPTGSRWLHLQRLCEERRLAFVCVQPLVTHIAREQEDYTRGKSDERDAVLIARLTGELRCYRPERLDEEWATLRHLGRRRARLITTATASVHQMRDYLAVAWPAALTTAAGPFESKTWLAALAVVTERCEADPGRLRPLGLQEFTALVRRELPRFGGRRLTCRIATALFEALTCAAGVAAQRRGLLRRTGWALEDLRVARHHLSQVEEEMVAQLDVLGVGASLASIPGMTAATAAAILAETGDPARFSSSRALVKHAGVAPASNDSGNYHGQAHISRRGRPALRLAVWRVTWGMLRHNPVLAAKYTQLTTREHDKLNAGQAHIACTAALLRWIYALTVHHTLWDPRIASGAIGHDHAAAPAMRPPLAA
jgi:transposase